MEEHKLVEKENGNKLQTYQREAVAIFDKYKQYKQALVRMLSEFPDMWDGYLRRISTDEHLIELTSYNTRPVHSPSYKAIPKS